MEQFLVLRPRCRGEGGAQEGVAEVGVLRFPAGAACGEGVEVPYY